MDFNKFQGLQSGSLGDTLRPSAAALQAGVEQIDWDPEMTSGERQYFMGLAFEAIMTAIREGK